MTVDPRDRRFYSLPTSCEVDNSDKSLSSTGDLVKYIRRGVIGKDKIFSGPYGLRKALYLDFTASGKSLGFIEDYIRNEVLPEYGNTHTTTSVTSLQTTLYRHEARDIVRNAVHASEHDAVIFVGSGSTGAIHKLIHALDLQSKPIVFVSPFEHHSNLLPWIELGAKVIRVKADGQGLVDLDYLESLLKKCQESSRQLIGCFSAASNVTGILADVDRTNVCLHKHGALAFWDYATAAPYVKIDMNPVSISGNQEYMYKDAVFISMHKFVGGVSTPGVLIAKKNLFRNSVPEGCGGGSVFFVRRDAHRYLQEPEMKEEGGTPAIVETIRAGLVFQLKQNVGTEVIMSREEELFRRAREAWQGEQNLVMLGNWDVLRLPIFSFLVFHPGTGRFLHHNYVSTLLNDLFGIQARGGCACAGPYAMDLLGMDEATASQIEALLAEDSRLDRTHLRRYREYSQREIIRPGFTRLNLPYFMDEESLKFTLQAVRLVAAEGWKLLPQYMFNPETGEWRQRNFQVFKDRKWLGHISYSTGEMSYRVPSLVVKGPLPESYQDCLDKARDLFNQASKTRGQLADHTLMFDEDSKQYRWFLLPSEAAACLHGNNTQNATPLPFCPPSLRERVGLPRFVESYDSEESLEKFLLSDLDEKGSGTLIQLRVESRCDSDQIPDSKHFSDGLQQHMESGYHNSQDAEPACGLKDTSLVAENMDMAACFRNNLEGHLKHSSESRDLLETISPVRTPSHSVSSSVDVLQNNHEKQIPTEGCKTVESNTNIPLEKETTKDVLVCSENHPKIEMSANDSTCKNVDTFTELEGAVSGNESRKRPGDSDQLEKDDEVQAKRLREKTEGAQSAIKKADIKKKRPDNKWFSPNKTIFAPFLKAVEEHGMIQDGDRVLVCLSGGKDSLSLLHTVRQYQFYSSKKGIKFEFGAVTVDPQTPSYDPSPLKEYLASLGVPYFYESQCILDQASSLPYECASICSFCSRMKRGRIYACARREGYNVLALGQHLDDLCESFLMSLFHNGILRTMKAHYTVEEGDLRVARPLVYVREKDLRLFAEKNKLPVISENCPACFEAPKERHRTKQLLASQEILFPRLFNSMMSAIKPIMAISKTQVKLADILQQGGDTSQDDVDI